MTGQFSSIHAAFRALDLTSSCRSLKTADSSRPYTLTLRTVPRPLTFASLRSLCDECVMVATSIVRRWPCALAMIFADMSIPQLW
jgi:hypothetical protein